MSIEIYFSFSSAAMVSSVSTAVKSFSSIAVSERVHNFTVIASAHLLRIVIETLPAFSLTEY
jgi:rubrerythrin